MGERYAAWAARWRVGLGFFLAVAYLIFAQPTATLLFAGGLIGCFGIAVRAYASGFLEKGRALASTGPYARTRNPLYLGSSLMGAGLALASARWEIAVALAAYFAIVYWPVMRREEAGLIRVFGDAGKSYVESVPFFFPTLGRVAKSSDRFRWARYRANREYEAALGFCAALIFLALKALLR